MNIIDSNARKLYLQLMKDKEVSGILNLFENDMLNNLSYVFSHPDTAFHAVEVFAELQSQLVEKIQALPQIANMLNMIPVGGSSIASKTGTLLTKFEKPIQYISYVILIGTSLKFIDGTRQLVAKLSSTSGLNKVIGYGFFAPILLSLKVNPKDKDVENIITDPKITGSLLASSLIFESGKVAAERIGIKRVYVTIVSVQAFMYQYTNVRYNSDVLKLMSGTIAIVTKLIHKKLKSGAFKSMLFSLISEASIPIIASIVVTKMKKGL